MYAALTRVNQNRKVEGPMYCTVQVEISDGMLLKEKKKKEAQAPLGQQPIVIILIFMRKRTFLHHRDLDTLALQSMTTIYGQISSSRKGRGATGYFC